jgi:hypothetical protein
VGGWVSGVISIEKTPSVNVTKCIWKASMFSSFLYVAFGWLAAMAYHKDSDDMLTILAGETVGIEDCVKGLVNIHMELAVCNIVIGWFVCCSAGA